MAALRLTLATFFSGAYQQAVAHHVGGKYGGWAAVQESPRSVGMLADYDDRFSAAGNCGDDCFWLIREVPTTSAPRPVCPRQQTWVAALAEDRL